MMLRNQPPLHLTYCLNLHPGEDVASVRQSVNTFAMPLKARFCPDSRFGVGLRVAAAAAEELADAGARHDFLQFLQVRDLYAFTINGFPYGRFHQGRIKEEVYRPDWRTPERVDYTLNLAHLLADLLPPGVAGSISTVPGSFREWIRSPADCTPMAVNLAECAQFMSRLRAQTGREIHLGLEPEPCCLLESARDAIDFFERSLLPDGTAHLRSRHGLSRQHAEEILRRHVGVCLDTCHLALAFEDPLDALSALQRAGIRISKIQVSAALWGRNSPSLREALRAFAEPTYLHQVKARLPDGRILTWSDLPEALAALEGQEEADVRVHVHVPLHWSGSGELTGTQPTITPAFLAAASGLCSHLEVETYTYSVLPGSIGEGNVPEAICRELGWLLGRLEPPRK